MIQKITDLLEEVRKLEKIEDEAAKKSHSAANEASGGLVASYSAAEDAEHARNTANLSLDKAKVVGKLMKELEDSVNTEAPGEARPVCFVSIELDGHVIRNSYLVNNPVFVSGFSLISSDSPLGKSLLGKTTCETFSYNSGEQTFSGKILEIA